LYVLHPEKSVALRPAKGETLPLDENRISFA